MNSSPTNATSHEQDLQNCERLFLHYYHPATIEQLKIKPLCDRFVVTVLVNNGKKRRVIPLHTIRQFGEVEEDEYIPLTVCCGCDATGPLGHICDEPECLDSGNIYADILER